MFVDKTKSKAGIAEEGMKILVEREIYILFGNLGEEVYRKYAPKPPNDSEHNINLIKKKFGADSDNADGRAARAQLFKNYDELLICLEKNKSSDSVQLIYDFVKKINPRAEVELINFTGLGEHLREISTFLSDFFLQDDKHSAFPELISDHNAKLLAFVVAPLHDVLKYLSEPHGAIAQDHEIHIGELTRTSFEGRTVSLAGENYTLTAADAEFISKVVGDHENLFKELGRDNWIAAEDYVKRAKAIFNFADTLTGTIVRKADSWVVDPEQLDKRFVDLYFRHIDLEKGKVFRPEWGVYAVKELENTAQVIMKTRFIQGSAPDLSFSDTLNLAALSAIDRALTRNLERKALGAASLFGAEELQRIDAARKVFEYN